jgi:hypothetical protein
MTDTVNVITVFNNKIWIDVDMIGSRHVMIQHEGKDGNEDPPFQYCSFNYDYRYTSNATIAAQAEKFAISLGAESPVECRPRPFLNASGKRTAAI